MALPQCAMAHWGSRVATSVKVCSDSLYWKECSSARPFSSAGCTSLEHVVGKFTLPSWSAGAADTRGTHTMESAARERRTNSELATLERVSRISASSLMTENDSTSNGPLWRLPTRPLSSRTQCGVLAGLRIGRSPVRILLSFDPAVGCELWTPYPELRGGAQLKVRTPPVSRGNTRRKALDAPRRSE